MKNQKTYTIVGALAALVVVGTVVGIFLTPASSQSDVTKEIQPNGYVSSPDSFLQNGGKSAVVAEISPKVLTMKRGESETFTITLEHRAATTDFKTLNVILAGVNGKLGLPSTANMSSLEERTSLLQKGETVPGLIDLSTFVTYSPAQVTLDARETKTITATVTIPSTLPDEMVGKSIHINPDIRIVDVQDTSPDRQSEAVVFSDVLSIVVEG